LTSAREYCCEASQISQQFDLPERRRSLRREKEKPMAVITVLQGRAWHVTRHESFMPGPEIAQGVPSYQLVQELRCVVDDWSVTMYGVPHVGEGDLVTLAGYRKPRRRQFRAIALRNDTTGSEHLAPTRSLTCATIALGLTTVACLAITLGAFGTLGAMQGMAALLSLLIGIPMGILLLVALARAKTNRLANETLRATLPTHALEANSPIHELGEEEAIAALQARPSLLKALARGFVAITGVGLVALSLLCVGLIVHDLATARELATAGGVVVLLMSIAAGVGGFALASWALPERKAHVPHRLARRRRRPPLPAPHANTAAVPFSTIKQQLLSIASNHGGRITAAEVAAALAMEQAPAEQALEEAARHGQARMLVSSEGVPVYEFEGLVASKATAKEPWDL
jgi:hypothetical protein